jgi:ribonuclease HI
MMSMNKEKYYAVKRGRTLGIYRSYADVLPELYGFKFPLHKSFSNLSEALHYLGWNYQDYEEFDMFRYPNVPRLQW